MATYKFTAKTPSFHVVLLEPEIPQNTGNIARTCLGLGAELHLIEPLGFSLEDRYLKRAGLDYWPKLEKKLYPSWEKFRKQIPKNARLFFLSKKSSQSIYNISFKKNDYFIFGKETKGLPKTLLQEGGENTITLPQSSKIRSYNLSNAVAMVVSEAYRQIM